MKTSGCILLLFLLLFSNTAKSTTWITIKNGSWSDSSVWLLGIAPDYSVNGTVIIKDALTFDEDIYLNPGALMQIDSNGGGLCGHYNITVYKEARLYKYGDLNLDTLFIKGGTAHFILPGPFLMYLTWITDGGIFTFSTTATSCLCAWDTCSIPIKNDNPPEDPVIPPVDSVIINNEYVLFPNPTDGNFDLKYSQANESTFYFYNVLGQIIFSTTLDGTSGLKNFINYNLSDGVYLWKVVSGDKIHQKGKHLILK